LKRRKRTKVKFPKVGKRTLKNAFELAVYKQLNNLKPPKSTVEYETEKLPYTVAHNYEPDFILTKKDGSKIYIETKGNGRAFDASVQRKMVEVKKQHPDKDIRILFYSDGKIGNKRKDGSFRRQSDWANQHGYVFAIREVPKEWLSE